MYIIEDVQARTQYNAAILQFSQRHALKLFIDGREFSDYCILDGSLTIKNQCSSSSGIEIGTAYVGEMTCTFLHKVTNVGYAVKERGSWIGAEIEVIFRLQVRNDTELDARIYEDVPMGIFTVAEANKTAIGIEVRAYDNMSKFDKPFLTMSEGEVFTGTFYNYLQTACSECGVTLGMTNEELSALPNGTEYFEVSADIAPKTWRECIMNISALAGGYATINRLGALVVRSYNNLSTSLHDFSPGQRYSDNLKFSDYQTNFDKLYIVYNNGQKSEIFGQRYGDGMGISLTDNIFLKRKTYGINSIGNAIFNAIQKITYNPFSAKINDPRYDLSDVLTFSGGLAVEYDDNNDGIDGCIMSYSWNYKRGYIIEGYGGNPIMINEVAEKEQGEPLKAKEPPNVVVYPTIPNKLPEFSEETLVVELGSVAGNEISNAKDGRIELSGNQVSFHINRSMFCTPNVGYACSYYGNNAMLTHYSKAVQNYEELVLPDKMRIGGDHHEHGGSVNPAYYNSLLPVNAISIGTGNPNIYGLKDKVTTELKGCKKITIMDGGKELFIENLGKCESLEVLDVQSAIDSFANSSLSQCPLLSKIYFRKSFGNLGWYEELLRTNITQLYLDSGIIQQNILYFGTKASKLEVFTSDISSLGDNGNKHIYFVGNMTEITLPISVSSLYGGAFRDANSNALNNRVEVLTIPNFNITVENSLTLKQLCPNLAKIKFYQPSENFTNQTIERARADGVIVEYISHDDYYKQFDNGYNLSNKTTSKDLLYIDSAGNISINYDVMG